jgi:hypothetical protein
MRVYTLFFLLLCLSACGSMDSWRSNSVCEVVANPRKFSDSDHVIVKGKVTEVIGIFGFNGFYIKDLEKDCSLAVSTEKITPNIGEEVIIKGKLKEWGSIGDLKFIYIEEINK